MRGINQMSEAAHRRFGRHRLAAEIDPDKTPHGQRIHADPGLGLLERTRLWSQVP
jgi:hypothetical protein